MSGSVQARLPCPKEPRHGGFPSRQQTWKLIYNLSFLQVANVDVWHTIGKPLKPLFCESAIIFVDVG